MRGIRQSLIKLVQFKGRGASCLFLFQSYERALIKLFAVFLKGMSILAFKNILRFSPELDNILLKDWCKSL